MTPVPYAHRRAQLAATIASAEIDVAFISSLVNVRYLTGFAGSNGAVLVHADGTARLATDGRYREQATRQAPDLECVITRDLVQGLLAGVPAGALGAETHVLSVDEHRALDAQSGDMRLCSLGKAVESLREVKDDTEIDALRTACGVSTEALEGLLEGSLLGRTERALARDLENRMFDLGADAVAFETILASGPNTAVPHHTPTDRVVQVGDFVKIDFGARVDGYHADCTRTVVAGSAAQWQRDVYAAVREAQSAGLALLTEGVAVAAPRSAVDQVLADLGWLEYFTTGLGHGVGLQIHEEPFLGLTQPGKLASRTALTMEPGIYLPGRGGVRIEDTAVVGSGAPEVLTTMTKDLLEIA